MKLVIISHTPHYNKDGKIVGWGPTVREINHLTKMFDRIKHIAPMHQEQAPGSSMRYNEDKVEFIPIKPYGGEKFSDKFSILTTAYHNLKIIRSALKKTDWVQFRAPTAMGLYVLPYLSLIGKPKRWVKYAGNWNQSNPPLSYRIQRWWLKNNFQRSKVTVNGKWKDRPDHVLDFRNPCLDNDELLRAEKISAEKDFNGKKIFCFAGSLTKNKGVHIILEALEKIRFGDDIEEFIFAGGGHDKEMFEIAAGKMKIKISFTGYISRDEMEKIYARSHVIILPSESEGFPKVISEAAAYGCVPILSDVSAVSEYFNDSNGFLLKSLNSQYLADAIDLALSNIELLKIKSRKCTDIGSLFTYDDYMQNLKSKIINT
ncbi:MAG: glycosyltransferase family 4 protein [Ignavibacteria bacterium]|nr:glycosyltransferase family 4 protein [Ignavibacteria bacterium]